MFKILVTGGAGFIGSAVVRLAIQKNYTVLNFDALTYTSSLESLSTVENNENYQFVKADLNNVEALKNVFELFSQIKF